MARAKIDVSKLYSALDAERTAKGVSWRQLAHEIGVSPSLFSRLGGGLRPDVDAFVTLVRWLGISPDELMVDERDQASRLDEPDLAVQVSALLRARHDLSDNDRELLQDVFRSALKHVRTNSAQS